MTSDVATGSPRTTRGGRPRDRIWTGSFLALFVISLVTNTAQSMMVSLVPADAAQMGAAPVLVGAVIGAFAISSLAVRPFVGATTLRFRLRTLLVVDLSVLVVAFVLYALARNVEMLFIARLVHGAGMGFLAPLNLALVAGVLPRERMAAGVGLFSLGQAIALGVGPAFGLFMAGLIGLPWTFALSAAMMSIAVGLVVLVPRDPGFRPTPFRMRRGGLLSRRALLPAGLIFLLSSAYAALNTFVVLSARAAGIDQPGLFFTVYAITLVVVRPVTGRLADRFGFRAVVLPGAVVFGAALVLLSFSDSLALLLVAAMLTGLGYGVCQPLLQTVGLLAVRKEDRALAGNTIYTGVDLSYLLAPIAAGAIASSSASPQEGYSHMFLWCLAPVAVALLIVLIRGKGLSVARPSG